jgi:hypothetical protein
MRGSYIIADVLRGGEGRGAGEAAGLKRCRSWIHFYGARVLVSNVSVCLV